MSSCGQASCPINKNIYSVFGFYKIGKENLETWMYPASCASCLMPSDKSEQPILIQELVDGVVPSKTNPEALAHCYHSTRIKSTEEYSRIEIRTPPCPIMRESRSLIHTGLIGTRLSLMPEIWYWVGPKEITEKSQGSWKEWDVLHLNPWAWPVAVNASCTCRTFHWPKRLLGGCRRRAGRLRIRLPSTCVGLDVVWVSHRKGKVSGFTKIRVWKWSIWFNGGIRCPLEAWPSNAESRFWGCRCTANTGSMVGRLKFQDIKGHTSISKSFQ